MVAFFLEKERGVNTLFSYAYYESLHNVMFLINNLTSHLLVNLHGAWRMHKACVCLRGPIQIVERIPARGFNITKQKRFRKNIAACSECGMGSYMCCMAVSKPAQAFRV